MSPPFQEQLTQAAQLVDSTLDRLLPTASMSLVADPMRHASMNGGKRLRAFLAIESARLFDVPLAQALRTAAAIECMHAYSLVHDDLPCMDDDDLRRGKPTVHVKWDEATAVLAGDALQTMSFEILAGGETSENPDVRLALIRSLAQAAGGTGMVLGQAQDIAAETAPQPLTLAQITELQANKTGALICWAADSGAQLAEQDPGTLRAYATAVGLAFQIQDDVLDVEGDVKTAGKRLQKDAEAGKATFVSLLGLEPAKARARSLVDEACLVLEPFGDRATTLRQVARFIIDRKM